MEISTARWAIRLRKDFTHSLSLSLSLCLSLSLSLSHTVFTLLQKLAVQQLELFAIRVMLMLCTSALPMVIVGVFGYEV